MVYNIIREAALRTCGYRYRNAYKNVCSCGNGFCAIGLPFLRGNAVIMPWVFIGNFICYYNTALSCAPFQMILFREGPRENALTLPALCSYEVYVHRYTIKHIELVYLHTRHRGNVRYRNICAREGRSRRLDIIVINSICILCIQASTTNSSPLGAVFGFYCAKVCTPHNENRNTLKDWTVFVLYTFYYVFGQIAQTCG